MALIQCGECGNQVSTSAAACPKCGAPVASTAIGTPLATIQQTSKRLKLQIIFASLAFWGGLIWAFVMVGKNPEAARAEEIPPLFGLAAFLIMFGFFWYLLTKFRIWWHHK